MRGAAITDLRRTRIRGGFCKLAILVLCAMYPTIAKAGSDPAGDEESEPEVYVDRLIDSGNLEPSITLSGEAGRNTSGNVRSLTVELTGSRISPKSSITGIDTSRLDRSQQEEGLSVSGRYQTNNYGLLGIDAQLRRGSKFGPFGSTDGEDWSGSVALTSRDLPLGDGWLADSGLGTITTPMISLVRRQTRFYLPATPIMGGAAAFNGYRKLVQGQPSVDPEPFASLNIAVGEPGLRGGLRLSDFTGLSGLSITGGGQFELSPRWSAGIQAIAVEDTRDPYAVVFPAASDGAAIPKISSQGAFGTLAYSGGDLRVQANAIWSNRSGSEPGIDLFGGDRSAAGALIDASYRDGRTIHSGGIYYFEPGMTWGTSAVINNAYGGYYRFSSSTQRWRWTLNLDAVDTIDGNGSSGVIVNGDVRRRLTFDTSVGLNSSLRVANGQTSTQFLGFVDFSTGLGTSRAEAGWGHDPVSDLYRIGFDQNWSLPASLPAGSRLSTQVSYEHRRQSGEAPFFPDSDVTEKTDSFGVAISAGATPFSGISFDASVAYNSNASSSATSIYGPIDSTGGALGVLSSQQGESFSATLVATARLSSNWSLTASYTDTTSNLTSRYGLPLFGLSPLGPSQGQIDDLRRSSFRLRAGYLTLRYSVSAGRPQGALGLRQFPVGGLGNLEGRVFLDSNDNGAKEPTEKGVAGIVVILDGIQAVRTDEAGFYRFEGVIDGPHRITLNADALPLPWFIEADDKRGSGLPFTATVEVGVRSTTIRNIPARRE